MPERWSVVVSAEHGGNEVPEPFRELFRGHEAELAGHRGWDPGSLELARALASCLDAPLVASTVSRLVVDSNRSVGHPRLHSQVTRRLDAAARRRILESYYHPHRRRVTEAVARAVADGHPVLHLGIHSFVEKLDGKLRRADVGLLYDPARAAERAFCKELVGVLREARPDLVLRRNYPYRGKADGLTTALRKRFGDDEYLGVEIEVNQKHCLGDGGLWRSLVDDLSRAVDRVVA